MMMMMMMMNPAKIQNVERQTNGDENRTSAEGGEGIKSRSA